MSSNIFWMRYIYCIQLCQRWFNSYAALRIISPSILMEIVILRSQYSSGSIIKCFWFELIGVFVYIHAWWPLISFYENFYCNQIKYLKTVSYISCLRFISIFSKTNVHKNKNDIATKGNNAIDFKFT